MKLGLRYTIKVVVEVDANDPSIIADILSGLQEEGEATIENIEVLTKPA